MTPEAFPAASTASARLTHRAEVVKQPLARRCPPRLRCLPQLRPPPQLRARRCQTRLQSPCGARAQTASRRRLRETRSGAPCTMLRLTARARASRMTLNRGALPSAQVRKTLGYISIEVLLTLFLATDSCQSVFLYRVVQDLETEYNIYFICNQ